MSTALESQAGQIWWIGKNLAHNLKFIPEDKLSWKPAPTANSALEIINHLAAAIQSMLDYVETAKFAPREFNVTNLQEAQELMLRLTGEYATLLRGFDPARLDEDVVMPWATFKMERALSMPVVDSIHHHGQIAYIQSLLGDAEFHFFEMDR